MESRLFHNLPFSSRREDGELERKVIQACGGEFPNLLFVEAGTAKIQSRNWDSLQTSLRDLIKDSFEQSQQFTRQPIHIRTGDAQLLSLRYDPEATLRGRWTEQLRRFAGNHKGNDGQRTFMIVCLSAEPFHAKMYKIIKKACDLTVGVQTFFVNFASLESRVRHPLNRSVLSIAGKLRRSIRLRNPPLIVGTVSAKPADLTVAVHITNVTVPAKDRIDSSDVSEIYLAALVSADLKTGTCYHTVLKLYNKAGVDNLDINKLFEPLLRQLAANHQRKVVIMRSGYFPERWVLLATDDGVLASQESADPRPSSSRPYTREDEFDHICTAFGKKAPPGGLTYITLKEDKLIELSIHSDDAKPESDQTEPPALLLVKNNGVLDIDPETLRVIHVHSKNASTGAIAVSIIKSRTAANTSAAIAKTPSSMSALPRPQRRSQKKTPAGGTTATMAIRPSSDCRRGRFGSPGAAQRQSPRPNATPTKRSQPENVPLTPDAPTQHAADDSHIETASEIAEDAESSSQLNIQDTENAGNGTENALTNADIEMMSGLWYSTELELLGTKWSVLTHLAHLAIKRALIHLENDDWDGTEAKGTATAPFFLPIVHKKVCDSLYYL